jgi:mRNA interferase YafQ
VLKLRYTATFKRDYKRLQKRAYEMGKLHHVIEILANGKALEEQYRVHALRGSYGEARDCHIGPDWVLIYAVVGEELRLVRTGTHADLFKK